MSDLSATRVKWSGVLWLSMMVALGGCLGGPAQQDHFYRLELPDPDTRFDPPPLKGTLQVKRPWADALTGARSLLYRQNSQSIQLHQHSYHQWVDSPTLIIQQEIAHYLRAAQLAEQVVTPELRVQSDYDLSCRITRLERLLDGSPRIVMELELSITHKRDRKALLLQTYRKEEQTNGDGLAASVEAYQRALSNILDRFLMDASGLANPEKATARP